MPNDNYFHLILNLHEDATDTESIYQKAEEVQSGVGGGEPSEDTTSVSSGKDTITATENERNVFYTDVKVFLEGVQVPHTSCAVSYGVGQPPTATIIIPAAAFLRDIPETTKVTVIFKDLVEQDGEYKWRLLFDGELSGITYSIDSNGATMSLSAFHTTAYLTTMQIMTQAGAQYLYNPTPTMIGEFVMQAPMGMSKVKTNIISQVMQGKNYASMADIVYLIMRSLIEAYKDVSAVSKWYWGKLGNDEGGYKILQRIYGVSSTAQSSPLITPDINGSTVSSGSGGSGGNAYYPAATSATLGQGNLVDKQTGIRYNVYNPNGEIGTGGNGKYSDKIIAAAKERLGIPYVLGGNGTTSTDCGMYLKTCWNAIGLDWGSRYVPSMVIEAREKGIWKEADGSYTAKAGDGIVVYADLGHIVMSDGNGGNYAASGGRGKTTHFDYTAAQYPGKIVGYIAINEV